jgi:hypothetical protein
MNGIVSFTRLPPHIKKQAAPEMLCGVIWPYYGDRVEHPGEEELRRWAGLRHNRHRRARQSPGVAQAEAGVSGEIRPPARTSLREPATIAGDAVPVCYPVAGNSIDFDF